MRLGKAWAESLRDLAILLAGPAWFFLSLVVPKTQRLTGVSTFPDFDDSTKSLVTVLPGTGARAVIFCEGPTSRAPQWVAANNCITVPRYSLRGVWLFHRCKHVYVTHGLFSFWKTSSEQAIVNIWHGMPLKKIGSYHRERRRLVRYFDFTIAHSKDFLGIVARAFDMPESNVVICKHPRLDQMQAQCDLGPLQLPEHSSLCVWLPTYRTSSWGIGHADGGAAGDPFLGESDLARIDAAFRRHGTLCLIKAHPMASVAGWRSNRYSNIVMLTDDQLASCDIGLYNLLGISDFLITDFSSVYFDYWETERPIILYAPDAREYECTRGLIDEARELLRHPVILDEATLIKEIDRVVETIGHRQGCEPMARYSATNRLLELMRNA